MNKFFLKLSRAIIPHLPRGKSFAINTTLSLFGHKFGGVITLPDGQKFFIDIISPVKRHLFFANKYEERDTQIFQRMVKSGDYFFDVGSSFGWYSILASGLVGMSGKVFAFDIRKFFDSVDQNILKQLINRKIKDENAHWLINQIIGSFSKTPYVGLPLGNVSSQLFANIYLNELDQFVKHSLKVKYYLRYCDDFTILGDDLEKISMLVDRIGSFLMKKLKLSLHEDKIIIKKHRQGIDFLGYVVLPNHRVIRTKTRKRIINKIINRREELGDDLISQESFKQSLNSFLGMIDHCNGYELEKEIIWLSGLAEIEI